MTVNSVLSFMKKFRLHPFDVFDESFRREVDLFISRAQPRRQARNERTEINAVDCFLHLAQRQTFRKRIQPRAVWTKTQANIQHSLRRQELFDQLAPQGAAVLHARFELEQDLPVVTRLSASLKEWR